MKTPCAQGFVAGPRIISILRHSFIIWEKIILIFYPIMNNGLSHHPAVVGVPPLLVFFTNNISGSQSRFVVGDNTNDGEPIMNNGCSISYLAAVGVFHQQHIRQLPCAHHTALVRVLTNQNSIIPTPHKFFFPAVVGVFHQQHIRQPVPLCRW